MRPSALACPSDERAYRLERSGRAIEPRNLFMVEVGLLELRVGNTEHAETARRGGSTGV